MKKNSLRIPPGIFLLLCLASLYGIYFFLDRAGKVDGTIQNSFFHQATPNVALAIICIVIAVLFAQKYAKASVRPNQ